MIRSSTGPGPDQLQFTVIIAYDPADGRIYGTAHHGYFGEADEEGIGQSEARLVDTLTHRPCDPVTNVETIVLPLDELRDMAIDRVDPATKAIIPLERTAADPLGCG